MREGKNVSLIDMSEESGKNKRRMKTGNSTRVKE
jgi:hypothetical protein